MLPSFTYYCVSFFYMKGWVQNLYFHKSDWIHAFGKLIRLYKKSSWIYEKVIVELFF